MSRLIVFSMLTLAAWAQSPPTVTRVYQGGNNPTPLSPNTVAYLVGAAFGTQPTISVNGENATLIGSKDALAAFFIPADLPTGPAAVVVTTAAGSSKAFPIVLVPTSPSISSSCAPCYPDTSFHRYGTGEPISAPIPGDVLEVGVYGLGATVPSPLPQLIIDRIEFPLIAVSTDNDATTLVLSANGQDSSPVNFAVRTPK